MPRDEQHICFHKTRLGSDGLVGRRSVTAAAAVVVMRPDHSTPDSESLPPSAAAHAHSSRSAAASQSAANAAASSRRMGSSGRAHGGGGEGSARPMKVVDVPELVLKLCKNILKKEREVRPYVLISIWDGVMGAIGFICIMQRADRDLEGCMLFVHFFSGGLGHAQLAPCTSYIER